MVKAKTPSSAPVAEKYEIRQGQSLDLLKELHILTRDGKLNQDSRRKLKQIYHLYQFIEPLMQEQIDKHGALTLVDHGAGKSYLGFILYDLFQLAGTKALNIYGVETRAELVTRSQELARRLGFANMHFLNLAVANAIDSPLLPADIQIVTALHACNTATDDAIDFALAKQAQTIVLIPCCQAEVAAVLKKNRTNPSLNSALRQLWYHPIQSREFGSHLTNVLRILRLTASGYSVTTTELIGFEHSMKNELIIARLGTSPKIMHEAKHHLQQLLNEFGLTQLSHRFAL